MKAPFLLVTHDQDVIEEVATRIWHFKDAHIEDFKGPYEEFLAYAKEKAAKPAPSVSRRASARD